MENSPQRATDNLPHVEHQNDNPEGPKGESSDKIIGAGDDPTWRQLLEHIQAQIISAVPWANTSTAKHAGPSLPRVSTNNVHPTEWTLDGNGSTHVPTGDSHPQSPANQRDPLPLHTKHYS